jgi:hypothetical protein
MAQHSQWSIFFPSNSPWSYSMQSYNLVVGRPNKNPYPQSDELVFKLYPDLPFIFQKILFASYTRFGAWFWQSGIHKARRPMCQEKEAVVFLFNLRSVDWSIAATILSALKGAILAFILFIHSFGLIKSISKGPVPAPTILKAYC